MQVPVNKKDSSPCNSDPRRNKASKPSNAPIHGSSNTSERRNVPSSVWTTETGSEYGPQHQKRPLDSGKRGALLIPFPCNVLIMQLRMRCLSPDAEVVVLRHDDVLVLRRDRFRSLKCL